MLRSTAQACLHSLALRRPDWHRRLRILWWRLRHRRMPPTERVEGAPDYPAYRAAVLAAAGPPECPPSGATPDCTLLLPVDGDQVPAVVRSLASVLAQQDEAWRLILLGDAASLARLKTACPLTDSRIVARPAPGDQAPSSDELARAVQASPADWFLLLAAGDELDPLALRWLRRSLSQAPDALLWYCDHEQSAPGSPAEPCFKTAWDPLRLRQQNYVGSVFCVARKPLLQALDQRPVEPALSVGPAILNQLACQLAGRRVVHLPLPLYRRQHREAAAARLHPAAAPAPEAVSVIVPSRDGLPYLAACIDSVLAEFEHTGIGGEILLVDNGSVAAETLDYFAHLVETQADRVRLLRYAAPFNFSAINNWAVEQAESEVLLLLNDDVAATEPGWLAAMLHALQPAQVGAVGARLLYPDGRLQHAGIALGPGGVAAHPGRGLHPDDPRLKDWGAACTRGVSAVTGACLLTRKSLYRQLGGLNETALSVAFNDVDYCLKVGEAGYRVVYAPAASLIHHESVSRGEEDTFAKQRRFAAEVAYMRQRWAGVIDADPFYSPHWSLLKSDLSRRWPLAPHLNRPRRGVGPPLSQV